jgi:hypothetical protein
MGLLVCQKFASWSSYFHIPHIRNRVSGKVGPCVVVRRWRAWYWIAPWQQSPTVRGSWIVACVLLDPSPGSSQIVRGSWTVPCVVLDPSPRSEVQKCVVVARWRAYYWILCLAAKSKRASK